MKHFLVLLMFQSCLVSCPVVAGYVCPGDDRPLGVVVERVKRSPHGVLVDFCSDLAGPYLVCVYCSEQGSFCGMPRYPIAVEETERFSAFVPGVRMDESVCVCVLVAGELTAQEKALTRNLLSPAVREQLRERHFLGVRQFRGGGRWPGFHARQDGTLELVDGYGGVAPVGFTYPLHTNRSDVVYVPVPFLSMSAHGGMRYAITTDGDTYWQPDTNSVPDMIYMGGGL